MTFKGRISIVNVVFWLVKYILHSHSLEVNEIMIETIVSADLPVDERLILEKNRLQPMELTGEEKRISIVTGIYGDELDGQYICYELIRRINAQKKHLKGIVDVYPHCNPLGLASTTRGVPMFELDMNRIFPGTEKGTTIEHVAARLIDDIVGSELCIDIHSSNIFLMETPQVRISEEVAEKLVPVAKQMNADFVWVHTSATVLESTLAHSLNTVGVPTLAVEMGVGMRINQHYGDQLVEGIFYVMKQMGIWSGQVQKPKEPIVSTGGSVSLIHAEASGVFVPEIKHGETVKKGQPIGVIMNALTGEVNQVVEAPENGFVFTMREYPIVYEGSLIARILGGTK